MIARAAETDDTDAGARPARRRAAGVRGRPGARPRRCSSGGRTSTRGSGSSKSDPTSTARSTSRCAAVRFAGRPNRCHGPGGLRSQVVALRPPGCRAENGGPVGPPPGTYGLRVRRINHVCCSIAHSIGCTQPACQRTSPASCRAAARPARSCPARRRLDRELPAERLDAVGEPAQAGAVARVGVGAAAAVVGDLDAQLARRRSLMRTRSSLASACLTALVRLSATTK